MTCNQHEGGANGRHTHVVSHIRLWRTVNGREPKDVHAEVFEIVQLGVDAVEIAYPIAVGIQKGGGVYLVDDSGFPPRAGKWWLWGDLDHF